MFDEGELKISFAFHFHLILVIADVILSLVILWRNIIDQPSTNLDAFVANSAQDLCSVWLLVIQLLSLLFAIVVAKKKSNYRGALNLYSGNEFTFHWNSLQKAPFTKRVGVKLRYWTQKLKPLKVGLRYLFIILAYWIFVAFFVICFGAPVLTDHLKTGAFVTGLCLQSIIPIILNDSPDLSQAIGIFQTKEIDPLKQLLKRNALCAFGGAWIGALPIPLDWDRPWQPWPLTCATGCFAASLLAHIWSLYEVTKLRKQSKHSMLVTNCSTNKKSQ